MGSRESLPPDVAESQNSPEPSSAFIGNDGEDTSGRQTTTTIKTKDRFRVKLEQKRNKPTLSCLECVEHKTKCDRGRPCLDCVKLQWNYEYTVVANMIASADRKDGGSNSKVRFVTKPPSKIRETGNASSSQMPPIVTDNGWPTIDQRAHRNSTAASGSSPYPLSNVPYAKSCLSNVFGVGSKHPFSNYSTCAGGLTEVVGIMPSKDQADTVIAEYFEIVDGVYPLSTGGHSTQTMSDS